MSRGSPNHRRALLPCGAVQVELLLTFEEYCAEEGDFAGEQGAMFAELFPQVRGRQRRPAPVSVPSGSRLRLVPRSLGLGCALQRALHAVALRRAPLGGRCATAAPRCAAVRCWPEAGSPAVPRQVVKLLYDADLVSESAIFDWAHEKENASKEERRFVELAKDLLAWLAQDSESESESEEESD